MAYRNTPQVQFPIEHYQVNGLPFGKRSVLEGVLWGIHLGEDIMVPAGTDVRSMGRGTVVYAALHAGDKEKGNWGHIIIIRHRHPKRRQTFYSLYGHLGTSYKRIGDKVDLGEPLGFVGEGFTADNGHWEAHLHFAIYIGPWQKQVLPGYWKDGDKRTRPEWWAVPSEFIANYNTEN
jgi:murein DD-endopeptidase MepM/ murein hydrolase activator NlpD